MCDPRTRPRRRGESPSPRDGRASHALGPERELDLVVEAQDGEVVRLDVPAWVVGPVAEESQRPPQHGLRQLGVAEDGREVDPPAGVGVDPGDAQSLDLLDAHAVTVRRGAELFDPNVEVPPRAAVP